MTSRVIAFAAPGLTAAYPVVFLFAQNVGDQVTADALWVPLLVVLSIAMAITALLALVIGNLHAAGVLVSLLAAAFLLYGHVSAVAGNLGALLPAAWFGSAVIIGIALWRVRDRAPALARAVAVVASVLVVLNTWTIARHTVLAGALDSTAGAVDADADARPDIYYLIFDRYAGAKALRDTYGFDNEPFLAELERRGFYVARDSHANYPRTPLSLVSSLSMDYLDHAALRAEASDGGQPINRHLRGRLTVPHTLTGLGYTYVHVATLWEASATNVDADVTLRLSGSSEFGNALFESSALGALTPRLADPEEEWTADAIHAHTVYQLDRLPKAVSLPGPKYVFAHVLPPHPPFVFDRDGSRPTADELEARGVAESYVRQLEFVNRRIVEIVDRILLETPDAIILIQADEGPWPLRLQREGDDFPWEQFTPAELEEKFGILNAYRLPAVDPETAGLYPTITPVNSFRTVFNAYFDTDLPMLPDRIYGYPDNHHFYDLFDITARFESYAELAGPRP